MRATVFGNLTLDTFHYVDCLPGVNQAVRVHSSKTYFGGRAATTAAILQALGVSTHLHGIVGRDFSTSGYGKHLTRLGIDISNVRILADEITASFIVYKDVNTNSYSFFSANAENDYCDILNSEVDCSQSNLVHLTKCADDSTTSSFLNVIRSDERPVVVSASVAQDVYHMGRSLLAQFLDSVAYMFFNQQEYEYCLASLGEDEVRRFLSESRNLKAIVVTLAERGSMVYSAKDITRMPAVSANSFADTLGAGDAFAGAFLYGVLCNWHLRKCGQFAATVASFVVESEGAQIGLPTCVQLEERFERAFSMNLW